jgi:ABC-2 type transport system ATP-binding protein
MNEAIIVKNVSKSYGKKVTTSLSFWRGAGGEAPVQALCDVSFAVSKGEVFGLIGPDGAGKTSLFRILCSLLLPDAGTATVDGYDVVKQMHEVRSRVGYMPGKFSLYQDLTLVNSKRHVTECLHPSVVLTDIIYFNGIHNCQFSIVN